MLFFLFAFMRQRQPTSIIKTAFAYYAAPPVDRVLGALCVRPTPVAWGRRTRGEDSRYRGAAANHYVSTCRTRDIIIITTCAAVCECDSRIRTQQIATSAGFPWPPTGSCYDRGIHRNTGTWPISTKNLKCR